MAKGLNPPTASCFTARDNTGLGNLDLIKVEERLIQLVVYLMLLSTALRQDILWTSLTRLKLSTEEIIGL